MISEANTLTQLGFRLTPADGKVAILPGWPDRALECMEDGQLDVWFRRARWNIAIITGKVSGCVVIDIDDKSRIEDFLALANWTMVTETRKGAHFFAKHPGYEVRNRKFPGGDLKGERAVVIAPPSVVRAGDGSRWTYRWLRGPVPPEALPLFREEWLPSRVERRESAIDPEGDPVRRVMRAQAYAERVRCVAGRKAHNALFCLVCFCRDVGLTPLETLTAVLLPWNRTNCFDGDGRAWPWSLKELKHKVDSAFSLEKTNV